MASVSGPSAAPSVIESEAVPPTMDSTLDTVAVLTRLPRISLSEPAPRSIEAVEAAVAVVTVAAVVGAAAVAGATNHRLTYGEG